MVLGGSEFLAAGPAGGYLLVQVQVLRGQVLGGIKSAWRVRVPSGSRAFRSNNNSSVVVRKQL